MPSHRMNSGIQAIDGIARRRLQRRVEQPARQRRIAGDGAEQGPGHDAEAEARGDPRSVADTWRCSSPVRASSANVGEDARGRRHQAAVG